VASEDIATGAVIGTDGTQFNIHYIPNNDIEVNFDIFFTLSDGATWDSDTLGDLNSNGGTVSIIGPNFNSTKTEVRYRVAADSNDKITTSNYLSLSFNIIDKAGVLSSAGGTISLATRLQLTTGDKSPDAGAEDKDIDLVSSKDSQELKMVATNPAAYIDVADSTLSFLNGSSNSNKAELGTIQLANDSSYYAKTLSSTPFDPEADLSGVGGELSIINGPFSASIASPGRVFIDVDDDGTYTEDADLIATTVTASEAKWDLSGEEIDRMLGKDTAVSSVCIGTGCPIIIEADGTTSIVDAATNPTAVFSIDYADGISKEVTKKLAHIKRNGSVCTLYNIPSSEAVDELSVRITNTGNKEGNVKAKLYSLTGDVLINNEDLVTVAPNQTVRVDAAQLTTLAGGTVWKGRAVLTLSSTIKDGDMEVFALVRNRAGGPLMNLSVGAQGNGGCGENK
jgi:hypothetical protein